MEAIFSHDGCFIPTLNKMGYMALSLDKYTKGFVDFCISKEEGLYLDIGCAFGVATFPVLYAERNIVACDMDKRHLEVMQSVADEKFLNHLTLVEGHLPDNLSFPANSFDAINISMVLHFLPGRKIMRSLRNILKWLKSEGRVYVTVSTPYQGTLRNFIPVYEKRIKESVTWPGVIRDIHQYIPQRSGELPKFNHVLTPEILKNSFEKCDFTIIEHGFFSRENIPQDIAYDGREYAGLIAKKKPC